ncbi:hypothetical protein ACTJJ4_07750 [Microbacterium sp. 22195]|uniref:hypothetical protein n=1 Tax=Microbacterium sp. 22195 TaxID=3453891 RepID=UPI003F879265
MTAVRNRTFELTTTVMLPDVADLAAYAAKLSDATRIVVQDYVGTVTAFLVYPDSESNDVTFGLRFAAIEPAYMDDIADEILDKAVALVAERDGSSPVRVEREGSVLVQA